MTGIENNPLVSVIMPNYNNEKYLAEAIESILNQTYRNFEFVIIDDCSTDNSWNIIQEYAKKDNRIKAFKNEENLKIVKTRNKGFGLMSPASKYIAIFDSDDISMPERFEKQIKFLEKNPDYGAVGSHTFIIDENSEIIGKRKYSTSYAKIKKEILLRSPFAQPSVIIRSAVLDKVGIYSTDGKYDRSRDYDLWIRIFDKYKINNLDQFLIMYRISKTQGKTTHLKETINSTIQVQSKWLFKKNYFSINALFKVYSEHCLLILPENFVLWLFKKLNYIK
jgi:glycosyltransferase involved in cell wall biosynthesis